MDQGRVNGITNWGYASSGAYPNKIYMTEWDADNQDLGEDDGMFGSVGNNPNSPLEPMDCTPFSLGVNDYIIAYTVYDDAKYIYGLIFYTLRGHEYECKLVPP